MLKCICAAPRYRVAATECIRSQSSMFNNSFQSKEPLKSKWPKRLRRISLRHGVPTDNIPPGLVATNIKSEYYP